MNENPTGGEETTYSLFVQRKTEGTEKVMTIIILFWLKRKRDSWFIINILKLSNTFYYQLFYIHLIWKIFEKKFIHSNKKKYLLIIHSFSFIIIIVALRSLLSLINFQIYQLFTTGKGLIFLRCMICSNGIIEVNINVAILK